MEDNTCKFACLVFPKGKMVHGQICQQVISVSSRLRASKKIFPGNYLVDTVTARALFTSIVKWWEISKSRNG
ncbi:hypothetical protein L484_027863 [Morus notabilis]|uniref:Uncharacterized protein n=1 Tax=Morus notabilis TaxID=981085 RepID=W9SFC5_9ROSA|nr:hypothetical protein L484_027863 [Morus notabilis]